MFNRCAPIGWEPGVKNATSLCDVTYRPSKAWRPTLVSDLHLNARIKTSGAVRSAVARSKHGRKVTVLQSGGCPPRDNLHTFKLDGDPSRG